MFSVFGEFTSSSGNKRSNRQLYLHPTHGSCYISDVHSAVGVEREGFWDLGTSGKMAMAWFATARDSG